MKRWLLALLVGFATAVWAGNDSNPPDKSSSGSGGGASDHDGWVYYFKPHPPDNAIVKVKVDGADDYGTPDRDHKYCLDGYWDGSESGVKVRLLYVTQEGYLFSDGCKSNTWDVAVTNNAQEVYPPEAVVAIKAQAKSGSTYYLTLKDAIVAAKARAKVTLVDSIILGETLTVTNSITLNLNTNTVTLGSALTNAFCFTSGANVSNGTINASLVTDIAESAVLRFTGGTRGKSVTLSDVAITGNGCLLCVDNAKVTLTNNCAFASVDTADSAYQAAIYCSSGEVTFAGGTYSAPTVLNATDLSVFTKLDGVEVTPPAGYVWANGKLVAAAEFFYWIAGERNYPPIPPPIAFPWPLPIFF